MAASNGKSLFYGPLASSLTTELAGSRLPLITLHNQEARDLVIIDTASLEDFA